MRPAKELRIRRKLTQKKLADLARLSKESIYRVDRGTQHGTNPKLREGLAAALEVKIGVLTGDRSPDHDDLPERLRL